MRFQKFISVILHPIVLPTIGTLLYFITIPHSIQKEQRTYLIGLIFVTTYVVPLSILIILKGLKLIESFQVNSIKERKIPLFLMILLFTVLGSTFFKYAILRDFGVLFYATSFGLIVVYIFFLFKLKVSLHMLSIGIMLGFFLVMGIEYITSTLPTILLIVLFSGLLGTSRLHLKAHTPKEVYLGFFLGVFSQISVYYVL